jgi:hypothetical protein
MPKEIPKVNWNQKYPVKEGMKICIVALIIGMKIYTIQY